MARALMSPAIVALCMALLLTYGDAERPTSVETADNQDQEKQHAVQLHQHGQLSKVDQHANAVHGQLASGTDASSGPSEGADDKEASGDVAGGDPSGSGGLQPLFDDSTVNAIPENGPMQSQLKLLLKEFGGRQTDLLQANQDMTDEVKEKIGTWVGKAKYLRDSHPDFKTATEKFSDEAFNKHEMATNIFQRHVKWQGKPVKDGPLGDKTDSFEGYGPGNHSSEEPQYHSAPHAGKIERVDDDAAPRGPPEFR